MNFVKGGVAALLCGAALIILQACSPGNSAAAGKCPRIGVLPDAADYPVKDGNGKVLALARLSLTNSACIYNKSNTAETGFSNVSFSLTVRVAAALSQGSRISRIAAPYVIATVAPDGVITGRQEYTMDVDVSGRTGTEDERVTINIPYQGGGDAAGHRVVVAFKLDEATVRLNRSRLGR